MPNSYAQTTQQSCPQCGETFDVEIWLIVDIVERPDLFERIRQETIHEIACPDCGPLGQMDARLLVFRPDGDPALLFSPTQQTTQEQDQEQARGLLEQLRTSLGDQWQDAWLATGLQGIQRSMLAAALSDGPEAALQQLQEQMVAQMPSELQEVLAELAQSGVEINSSEDLERALDARPDLRQKLEAIAQQQNEAIPDEPQRILAEAGALGQAVLQSLIVQSIEELRAILHQNPELYTDESLALLTQLLTAETRPQAQQLLRARLALYQHCQAVGVETALAEAAQATSQVPEGLTTILHELAQSTRLSDMPRRIMLCQQALEQLDCAEQPQLWGALHNELANSLAQTPRGRRAENIEQAIHHYQQALEVNTRQAYPEDWAMAQNNLGLAYKNRICGERAENLEQAIQHFRQALEVYTRHTYPEDWACTQNNLG